MERAFFRSSLPEKFTRMLHSRCHMRAPLIHRPFQPQIDSRGAPDTTQSRLKLRHAAQSVKHGSSRIDSPRAVKHSHCRLKSGTRATGSASCLVEQRGRDFSDALVAGCAATTVRQTESRRRTGQTSRRYMAPVWGYWPLFIPDAEPRKHAPRSDTEGPTSFGAR